MNDTADPKVGPRGFCKKCGVKHPSLTGVCGICIGCKAKNWSRDAFDAWCVLAPVQKKKKLPGDNSNLFMDFKEELIEAHTERIQAEIQRLGDAA